MEDDYGDEMKERQELHEIREEDLKEMLEQTTTKENNLTRMFADIDMKLKAIAETLQGQIEEMKHRIEALEKK